MARRIPHTYSMRTPISTWFSAIALITASLALIQPAAADRFTASLAGSAVMADRGSGANIVVKAGYCPDGSYGCSSHERSPAPSRDAYASHLAPPQGAYEAHEPPPLPPCQATRSVSHVPPFDRPIARDLHPDRLRAHRLYDEDSCGVRCWYRRLTTGYCGRGCDYYIYRAHRHPTGNLKDYGRRQVACSGY